MMSVLQGDCMVVLPTLPADHFHCVVTSPPYFALRSYLDADHPDKGKEIGSEPTPDAFIQTMVAVFREVRRVLHPSGLCFVNLGDGYDSGTSAKRGPTTTQGDAVPASWAGRCQEPRYNGGTPGQLLNIPHRVAEALRQDGWIWRQTIVWKKPSPMPESCKGWRWERCRVKVKGERVPGTFRDGSPYVNHGADGDSNSTEQRGDGSTAKWQPCPGCPKCSPHGGYVLRKGKGRCTTGHEYVFIFAKTAGYFWDSAAFVEESAYPNDNRKARQIAADYDERAVADKIATINPANAKTYPTRNPRTVWTISAEPTSAKHFASFPTELARRCLQAGTSDGGCCPECGMPWAPVVEQESGWNGSRYGERAVEATGGAIGGGTAASTLGSPGGTLTGKTRILAYRPTCECREEPLGGHIGIGSVSEDEALAPEAVPCRALDPFAGTGTVAQVAQWLGREHTSIELNPEYVAMIHKRLKEEPACARKSRRNVTTDTPPDCPLLESVTE